MMKGKETKLEKKSICCAKCSIYLEPGKVKVAYLENTFPTEIMKCPKCGQVYVPEDLAKGKMLEVEKTLEEK
jgi:RNase P subunit RPR2